MSARKCEKCDRPATHKFTRIINGEVVDLFFCQEHAAQFSPLQLKVALTQMELTQLLAGLLKTEQGQKAAEPDPASPALKCQTCGWSFHQYRQTMLLGCSDCYHTFEKHLREDLRRYHGTTRHCGKQPAAAGGSVLNTERLEILNKRLATAIQDEDFELAAQLRDQIREMTGQQEQR
jgi:protein arginine kinase activator